MTLSKMPLTNCADWPEPNRLANSTASSMATRPGVSLWRSSKAASRNTLRSVAAIRFRLQLAAVCSSSASTSARCCRTPATKLRAKLTRSSARQTALNQLIAHRRVIVAGSDRPGKGLERQLPVLDCDVP